MIKTYDVGSLPLKGDLNKLLRGVEVTSFIESLFPTKYSSDRGFFEEKIKSAYLDKIRAGIDIPNYPQFRDMNEMFLKSIRGIEKTDQGYVFKAPPSIRRERLLIPEVAVIKERSREISEEAGEPLKIKICVTGPYTLSSLFVQRRSGLFSLLGNLISQIVENNIFKNKFGEVVFYSMDEPVFGLLDDPLLDYGFEGREELLRTWENILYRAKSRNVRTSIHLHNTSNKIFWQINSLDVVESHVDDPLYSYSKTRAILDREDKFLKAIIAITNFDTLIRNSILKTRSVDEDGINTQLAATWTAIRKEKVSPAAFLEGVETMIKRLNNIIKRFGKDRVPYAGPECGLRSFPTYSLAIECLRRIALAVRDVNSRN